MHGQIPYSKDTGITREKCGPCGSSAKFESCMLGFERCFFSAETIKTVAGLNVSLTPTIRKMIEVVDNANSNREGQEMEIRNRAWKCLYEFESSLQSHFSQSEPSEINRHIAKQITHHFRNSLNGFLSLAGSDAEANKRTARQLGVLADIIGSIDEEPQLMDCLLALTLPQSVLLTKKKE